MRASEVMTGPVITVPPDMELKQAAWLLVEHAIGALPVVEDGNLVGIVSEADLVALEVAPDPRAHLAPVANPPVDPGRLVSDVMTREVISLPADADAAQAARLLLERRKAQVPIVAGRRVVGILARRDLLRVPTREDADIEGEVGRLLAEELGEPVPLRVSVHNGVVELTGDADASARRLAALLARSVPGVVDVHVNGPRS